MDVGNCVSSWGISIHFGQLTFPRIFVPIWIGRLSSSLCGGPLISWLPYCGILNVNQSFSNSYAQAWRLPMTIYYEFSKLSYFNHGIRRGQNLPGRALNNGIHQIRREDRFEKKVFFFWSCKVYFIMMSRKMDLIFPHYLYFFIEVIVNIPTSISLMTMLPIERWFANFQSWNMFMTQ